MLLPIKLQKDYTQNAEGYQLKLPLNFETITPLDERTKTLQVAKTFLKYRQQDLERILSEEGIIFRTNRSIQAEGSFGDLKQDMQFRRYLSKGTANVPAESTLLAMARNINKLHNKIQKGKTGTHLFPLKSA